MAILKNTVQVNNGNTGWNSSHVLNALEETFYQLGWNSGSQVNGVVTTCLPPGGSDPWQNDKWATEWQTAGGELANVEPIRRVDYWVTDDSVNETFTFRRAWYVDTGSTSTANNINYEGHGFSPGDEFLYYQGMTNKNSANPIDMFVGATNGQSLFVAPDMSAGVPANYFKIYATASDATDGINEIDITNLSSGYFLTRTTTQTTIDDINMQDTIKFHSYGTTLTTQMRFQDQAGALDPLREINNTNYDNQSPISFPTYDDMTSAPDQTIEWIVQAWQQGTYYVTGDASTYSVPFNVNPQGGQHYLYQTSYIGTGQYEHTWLPAYWDYTVPADGTRSALNLRVYRRGTGSYGRLFGIEVLNLNSTGWSDGDTFTIPGDQIGGETPANDVQFGVNTPETSTNARDGICSVSVQNFGAGVNSFLKLPNTKKLVLRLENDAAKAYGTTYYVFDLDDNNYQLKLDSFIDPDFRNYLPNTITEDNIGHRGGIDDLDYSSTDGDGIIGFGTNYDYATNSTPTAYPLKIVTYRAQAPQDTDFAIIQFVQSINGIETPYYTFSLPKGTQYGQNVWDLDYVYQGFITRFYGSSQSIRIESRIGGSYSSREDTNIGYSRKRESLFGYVRDVSDNVQRLDTEYSSNRYKDNRDSSDAYVNSNDSVIYYRDSTYDKELSVPSYSGNDTRGVNVNDFVTTQQSVSASANFDRVIKGISLHTGASPNLYTLPEDFVLIDFNFTPGATTFLPGDTITISASEVYEVIQYSYTNSATTYDRVASNSVHGILFCARVV